MTLKKEKVSTAVSGLFKVAEKLKKDSLIDEVGVIQLQISLTKIPPKEKQVKLKLPHGLKNEKRDVCLFVKDLDGGKDREYEPTKRHFEEMFATHNISGISEIIPLKSLKLEYKPYEAKRNLSNAYDVFLADARIIRLLPSFLGKHFYGRNKKPVQVDLDAKNLKEAVDTAINNSRCDISNRGASSTAVIANLEMTETDVVDNVISCATQLSDAVPGGWDNVKLLSLKTSTSPSIPIYMSAAAPQDVTIPKSERAEPVEAEEISTVFGAKVKVYPSGRVKVIKDGEADDEDVPKKRRRLSKKKKTAKKAKSTEPTKAKSTDSATKTDKSETKKAVKSVEKAPSKSVTKKSKSPVKSDVKTKKKSISKVVTKSASKIPAKAAKKKASVKTPVIGSKRKLKS